MRKNIILVERISLTDVRLILMNFAKQPTFLFKQKRAWERRFTTGATTQALASSPSQTVLDNFFFEKHQIATLNLHLKRSYYLLVNLYHYYSHYGKSN